MTKEIAEAYKNEVTAQVRKTAGTSWGGEESTAVIEKITDAAYLGESPEGFDAIRDLVKALVNPSAFRQQLGKLPPTSPMYVKPAEKGSRGGVNQALSLLS
jgi:hypothetical protein